MRQTGRRDLIPPLLMVSIQFLITYAGTLYGLKVGGNMPISYHDIRRIDICGLKHDEALPYSRRQSDLGFKVQ